MPPSGQRVLTVKVPLALERRLESAARRLSAPKSELMRHAIERYLSAEVPAPRSFAAEAADLAGSLDGPRDLSTGKRHLRDYGK